MKRIAATITPIVLLSLLAISGPAYSEEPDEPRSSSGTDVVIGTSQTRLATEIVVGGGKAPDYEFDRLPDTQQRDIEKLAKLDGVSPQEYSKIALDSESFSTAASEVAGLSQDTFLLAEWRQAPDLPRVTFTDEPSDEVLAVLRELPFDTEVRHGAPFNESGYEEYKSAALQSLSAELGAGAEGATASDYETLGFTVAYSVPDQAKSNISLDAGDLESRIQKETGSDLIPVPIRFVLNQSGKTEGEATVRGGKLLSASVGGTAACTTGFSVRRNGVNGVTTADHCPNALYLNGESGVISYVGRATQDGGASYDLQFHRTLSGHNTHPRFRADTGDDIRTVVAATNPVAGDPVCHYGAGTKEGLCTYIYLVNECLDYSGRHYCGASIARDYISAGGNSGGPWYRNNTAKGTHGGWTTLYGGKLRSHFVRIGLVSSRLDATVLKG